MIFRILYLKVILNYLNYLKLQNHVLSKEKLEIGNTVSLDLPNEFLVQNSKTDITNGKHQDQAMTTNRAAGNQKSRKKVSNGYDNIEWKDYKPAEGLT